MTILKYDNKAITIMGDYNPLPVNDYISKVPTKDIYFR